MPETSGSNMTMSGECAPTPPPEGLKEGIAQVIKSQLTRQRYVALVQLGVHIAEELDKHGLKREEYCEFGRIMEKLMQLK